ncbi:hypothetical protein [Candidatus Aquarickettsia rohweri]|uniref:Uncharacterized protein n=1 Tax=Candidatus Aquarickettsia rohweri TaxID=2602574 RepID=A0A3R9ZQX2_9RICK|nr:hypothetical protein [Candidatus Aquarickettsia rohweri]RST70940.1 hypothetical protein EIC27_01200 [Candidatus Aquarickettsia rohweri]
MSYDNSKIEVGTNRSITDSLKNGVDYAISILNSANKWLNDPFKFPVAEADSVFVMSLVAYEISIVILFLPLQIQIGGYGVHQAQALHIRL